MTGKIRITASVAFLMLFPPLASCQALRAAPTTAPGPSSAAARVSTCSPGSKSESISPLEVKMTSPSTGWALAQCSLAATPTFANGSTLDCFWPPVEQTGILRTTDGGGTWTDVSPPSVRNRTWHHAQFFLDATHAWVAEVSRTADTCVSQVTTYRTGDGGQRWQRAGVVDIKSPKPTDDIFNLGTQRYLDFIDSLRGWLLIASPPDPSGGPSLLSESRTLYATSDGGLHWNLISTNPGRAALGALPMCHPNYYLGTDMSLGSATTGWLLMSCPAAALLVTRDAGATWRAQQLPTCACPMFEATLFDSSHGIITGQQSDVMLATSDGGATWTQRQVPVGALKQLSFTDPQHGWLVSLEQQASGYDTAVYQTADGGGSWSLLGRPGFATSTSSPNTYYPISAVQFVSADAGFVSLDALAGPQGASDPSGPQFQLLATADGGRSWQVVLKQVAAQPCGSNYTQLGNGGESLAPAKMVSATTAWARGGLRTVDGGLHWRDVSPPDLREGSSTPLYPPGYTDFYLDGDHAWQAAVYGSLTSCNDHVTTFATADGGKTWQQSATVALHLPANDQAGYPQLGFTSPRSGWLWVPIGLQGSDMGKGPVITSAYLFATSDGGLTWRRLATIDPSRLPSLPTPSGNCPLSLGQVTFSSATAGWMTADCVNSRILTTSDGGVTWTLRSLNLPCQCQVELPTFVDEKHGFVQFYGNDPTATGPSVMSTSDGGATWRTLPVLPSGGYSMALTFADADNLWDLVTPPEWTKMSGGKDSLYHSSDGGQSWKLVQDGLPIGRAYQLLFADPKNGMVAQPRNATWSLATPGFADANDIELVFTSDGGHTWKEIKPAQGT